MVDKPRFLGPTIVAQRNRPARVVFYNLLPKGSDGDLFLPVDSTLMGAGEGNMDEGYDPTPTTGGTVDDSARNPVCTYKDGANRGVDVLHRQPGDAPPARRQHAVDLRRHAVPVDHAGG